ncbi:MAG: tetratricopeptide repeat protein, partial [Myxococcales bacterium]|nr:tetratricopeptide repeat protein [Myxococcales bacterium]
NLAIALRASNRHDEAIPHYERALALGRRGEGLLFDLAVSYEQVGQYQLAIETYERFVRDVQSRDPAAAQRARDSMQRLRDRL